MTHSAFVQRLLAIKVLVDTLVAEAAGTPKPAPDPDVWLNAQPATSATSQCEHPAARRDAVGGFGGGPKRFRCDLCGATLAEGT